MIVLSAIRGNFALQSAVGSADLSAVGRLTGSVIRGSTVHMDLASATPTWRLPT